MKKLILSACLISLSFGYSQDYPINTNDIITYEYPEAKAEVMAVLDDIEQSVRDNDMDRLISHHAYGPKFTEFKNGEKRTSSEDNEKFEREFIGSFTSIEKWKWDDLKIAVYENVANVTFHADFVPYIEDEKLHMTGQFTLLFVKTQEGWKIVHEHMSALASE